MRRRREIAEIAMAAGASDFEIVRQRRHLIVDFTFPEIERPIRMTLATSTSDHRSVRNHISDLKRAAREARP
jgi:hypothetical protein